MSESAATKSKSAATKKRVTFNELVAFSSTGLSDDIIFAVDPKTKNVRACSQQDRTKALQQGKKRDLFSEQSKLNNQQDYEVKIDGKTIFIISFAVAGTIYVGIKLMFNGGKKQSYRTYKNRTVKNKTYKNRK